MPQIWLSCLAPMYPDDPMRAASALVEGKHRWTLTKREIIRGDRAVTTVKHFECRRCGETVREERPFRRGDEQFLTYSVPESVIDVWESRARRRLVVSV